MKEILKEVRTPIPLVTIVTGKVVGHIDEVKYVTKYRCEYCGRIYEVKKDECPGCGAHG